MGKTIKVLKEKVNIEWTELIQSTFVQFWKNNVCEPKLLWKPESPAGLFLSRVEKTVSALLFVYSATDKIIFDMLVFA